MLQPAADDDPTNDSLSRPYAPKPKVCFLLRCRSHRWSGFAFIDSWRQERSSPSRILLVQLAAPALQSRTMSAMLQALRLSCVGMGQTIRVHTKMEFIEQFNFWHVAPKYFLVSLQGEPAHP